MKKRTAALVLVFVLSTVNVFAASPSDRVSPIFRIREKIVKFLKNLVAAPTGSEIEIPKP